MTVRVSLIRDYNRMGTAVFKRHPVLQELTEEEIALLKPNHQKVYRERAKQGVLNLSEKKKEQQTENAAVLSPNQPQVDTKKAEQDKVTAKGLEIEKIKRHGVSGFMIDFGQADVWWNKDSLIYTDERDNETQIKFNDKGEVVNVLWNKRETDVKDLYLSVVQRDVSLFSGNFVSDLIGYARNGGHWGERGVSQHSDAAPQKSDAKSVETVQDVADRSTKVGKTANENDIESSGDGFFQVDFDGSSGIRWNKDNIEWNFLAEDGKTQKVTVEFDEKGTVKNVLLNNKRLDGTQKVKFLGEAMGNVATYTSNTLQELIGYARHDGNWVAQENKVQQEVAGQTQPKTPESQKKGKWSSLMDEYKIQFTDDEKAKIQKLVDSLKRGDKDRDIRDIIHSWSGGIFGPATSGNMNPGFLKIGDRFSFKVPQNMKNPDEIESFAKAMFVFDKYKDRLLPQREFSSRAKKRAQQDQLDYCLEEALEEQRQQVFENQPKSTDVLDNFEGDIEDKNGNETTTYYPAARKIMFVEADAKDKNVRLCTIIDLLHNERVEFLSESNGVVDYREGDDKYRNFQRFALKPEEAAKYEAQLRERVEKELQDRNPEKDSTEKDVAETGGMPEPEAAPEKKGWWRRLKDWLKRLFRRSKKVESAETTGVPEGVSSSDDDKSKEASEREEPTVERGSEEAERTSEDRGGEEASPAPETPTPAVTSAPATPAAREESRGGAVPVAPTVPSVSTIYPTPTKKNMPDRRNGKITSYDGTKLDHSKEKDKPEESKGLTETIKKLSETSRTKKANRKASVRKALKERGDEPASSYAEYFEQNKDSFGALGKTLDELNAYGAGVADTWRKQGRYGKDQMNLGSSPVKTPEEINKMTPAQRRAYREGVGTVMTSALNRKDDSR